MTAPFDHYQLRSMHLPDVPSVAAIEAAANSDPWSESLFASEFDVDRSTRDWLVACTVPIGGSRGRICGFGGVFYAAGTAHIMNLGVGGDHRRRGLGERICDGLMVAALTAGCHELTLEVRVGNRGAIALYEHLGMVRVGVRPRYYTNGEDAAIYWFDDLASAVEDRRQKAAPNA